MLKPEDLCAVIDTREQQPLELSIPSERGTLPTGDYSLKGMEDLVVCERKTLDDLVGCMTQGRERFERELQRLKSYSSRVVVVEADWEDVVKGRYRSRMQAVSAKHTVASWTSRYAVPFQFVGRERKDAADYVSYFLFCSAKRMVERLKQVKRY